MQGELVREFLPDGSMTVEDILADDPDWVPSLKPELPRKPFGRIV